MDKETGSYPSHEKARTGREANILRLREEYRKIIHPRIQGIISGDRNLSQTLTGFKEEQKATFLDIVEEYAAVSMYGRLPKEQVIKGIGPDRKYKWVDPVLEGYKVRLQDAGISDIEGSVGMIQNFASNVNNYYMKE